MFNFHRNHKILVLVAFFGFVVLSFAVAIFPAYQLQENTQPLTEMKPLTDAEAEGLRIFIREGCVACHTQQVRSIEMDQSWGGRPSIPSDFYYTKQRLDFWRQSPSLLGSERTGPDLTNVGARQPSEDWHLLHLYNPRQVVKASIMPSYPWLFEEKTNTEKDDKTLSVSPEFKTNRKEIVATSEALALVAYLKSLKQTPLPGSEPVNFIPSTRKKLAEVAAAPDEISLPDGKNLYMSTCAACHQAEGTGLPGAFPPLAGSEIVNNENPDLMIRIILQGYDARPEYAQMPAFADQLTDEEIAAIANHERLSWGNQAKKITADQVKKIRNEVNNVNQP